MLAVPTWHNSGRRPENYFMPTWHRSAGRRPPLLLPQEEDWADDEAGTIRKLTPDRPSPIDRNAPVLDVEALEAKPLDPRALDAQMNLMFDRNRRPEPDAAGRQRRIG